MTRAQLGDIGGALRRMFTRALSEHRGEDALRLESHRIENSHIDDRILIRACISGNDWRQMVPGCADVHDLQGGVENIWSETYVRHYLEEITIPCQRALYGLLAEPRGVEFGMELRAALDSFEHHVLECRGIPTNPQRRRPVYQEVTAVMRADAPVDMTYTVRPEMSAWAEEFLEYGFRLRAHTLGGVDVIAFQRSMKMLTQAPMVREEPPRRIAQNYEPSYRAAS